MSVNTKKYDDGLSDTQSQLALHNELERRGKVSKTKKILLNANTYVSNILGSKGLHLIDTGIKRGNQRSLVNVAQHAQSQFSFAGVNKADKVKEDQFQVVGIQGAKEVGGIQAQVIGMQGAELVKEDQAQGIGFQGASKMDVDGTELPKGGVKGNQTQFLGSQIVSNIGGIQRQEVGFQAITEKGAMQSQGIGYQSAKNTTFQEQMTGAQVALESYDQRQKVGIQGAKKVGVQKQGVGMQYAGEVIGSQEQTLGKQSTKKS